MAWIVLMILLAVPVVTGIVERRDEESRDILRMADRDRRRQRTTQPQRRMRYMRVYTPHPALRATFPSRGRQNKSRAAGERRTAWGWNA